MKLMKALREKSGVTLRRLSEETAVSESYLSLIETGARRPSVAVAKRIAAALGFDWTRFFEDGETPEESA